MKNIVVLDDSVMTKNLVTLTEVINGIDLIVADYSSAFSDFVILDRPVCFLDNDIELYKKNRGITFDNIKFWSPGPFIKGLNEFVDEVKKLLNNKDYYKEERKNYVDMNFGKNIENCSKNVADYLFKDNNIQKFFDKKKKTADSKLIELYGENLNLKSCVYITKENEDNNIKYIYELSSDTVKDGVDYLPPIIMLKNKISTANCTLNMYNNNVTKEDFDNLCDIKVTDDKTTDFILGTNIIVSQVTDGDALILTYEAVDESGNKSKPLEIKLKNNIN